MSAIGPKTMVERDAGRVSRHRRCSHLAAPTLSANAAIRLSGNGWPGQFFQGPARGLSDRWHSPSQFGNSSRTCRGRRTSSSTDGSHPRAPWSAQTSTHRFRTKGNPNEHLGRHESATGPERTRPVIGGCRPPNRRDKNQPDHSLPQYTEDLLNPLHGLGRLVAPEPARATLLSDICAAPLLTEAALTDAAALASTPSSRETRPRRRRSPVC